MEGNETEYKIINILSNYNSKGIRLHSKTKLIKDLGLDSISIIEVITLLETEFNINISNEEIILKNFDNITKLQSFIDEKHKEQG